MHTFAFEPENLQTSAGKGLRKFLVTSYSQLWHTVKSLAHNDHHGSFYEIIPEGAACKLYFDLEFRRDLNPDADGGAMVQTLIKVSVDSPVSSGGKSCFYRLLRENLYSSLISASLCLVVA